MANYTIPLQVAREMTGVYRSEKENILKSEFQDKNILCNCETFDRAPFDTILGMSNCTAIRIYFGMTAELKVRAIVVGVDENNNDILPDGDNAAVIIEEGRPCPDFCPVNPL